MPSDTRIFWPLQMDQGQEDPEEILPAFGKIVIGSVGTPKLTWERANALSERLTTGRVAQRIEQLPTKQKVVGSNPTAPTFPKLRLGAGSDPAPSHVSPLGSSCLLRPLLRPAAQ
jgi:hypothetical protein